MAMGRLAKPMLRVSLTGVRSPLSPPWAGGSRVKFPSYSGETIATNQDAYGLRGCGASM